MLPGQPSFLSYLARFRRSLERESHTISAEHKERPEKERLQRLIFDYPNACATCIAFLERLLRG